MIWTEHKLLQEASAGQDRRRGRYLAAAGPQVYRSVLPYQLDGLGIQLFDRIEGDYFAILGLPILLLFGRLRESQVLGA